MSCSYNRVFQIPYLLSQYKKPFEAETLMKAAFIEVVNVLFEDFKNKTYYIGYRKDLVSTVPDVCCIISS